jgi:hypothetical protein
MESRGVVLFVVSMAIAMALTLAGAYLAVNWAAPSHTYTLDQKGNLQKKE